MAGTRTSLSISIPNDEWIQAQIESGDFFSRSEVINDLIRVHERGVCTHGEAQEDTGFLRPTERIRHIADDPLMYPLVDNIREGYRRSV